MGIVELIMGFFEKLMSLYEALKGFLFEEISFFGTTFCVWEMLGGGALITILIIVIVKAFNPL